MNVRRRRGCLVNARAPAAVAAGNTETSSRIVDVVFAALAALPVPAQGQGTMNNVVLGNERFTYYETIAAGRAACPDADGPVGGPRRDVEHALDAYRGARARLPAARRALRARLGSGGDGRFRGGDGVVRELRALEPYLSLLTQRRARAQGAEAGRRAPRPQPAERGELPASATVDLEAGDVLRIGTPRRRRRRRHPVEVKRSSR